MSKNREPMQSLSESGEEEASSEEVDSQESESESEGEPPLTQVAQKATPATQKKALPQPSAKPQADSSSEEEESGSESGSESDRPDSNVRSISSRPAGPLKPISGASKSRSRPIDPEPVTPVKSTATKRPAEDKGTEAKDAKKAKKKPDPQTSEKKTNDDSKKLLFQRLWSEDDEIVILEGMIEYVSKKKLDPVADLSAFHEFIKKNLHVDVTRTQLQDKIRRLRKKYVNNKSKEKGGKDRTFSKPHEQKAYELSKLVWGNEKEKGAEKGIGSPKANGGSTVRKAASKKAVSVDNEEPKDPRSAVTVAVDGVGASEGEKMSVSKGSLGGLSGEDRILMAGIGLFESGKGREGEKMWKKLKVDEAELLLKQYELRAAQTRLVLDVLKSEQI